jgi:hypothetical protein
MVDQRVSGLRGFGCSFLSRDRCANETYEKRGSKVLFLGVWEAGQGRLIPHCIGIALVFGLVSVSVGDGEKESYSVLGEYVLVSSRIDFGSSITGFWPPSWSFWNLVY